MNKCGLGCGRFKEEDTQVCGTCYAIHIFPSVRERIRWNSGNYVSSMMSDFGSRPDIFEAANRFSGLRDEYLRRNPESHHIPGITQMDISQLQW